MQHHITQQPKRQLCSADCISSMLMLSCATTCHRPEQHAYIKALLLEAKRREGGEGGKARGRETYWDSKKMSVVLSYGSSKCLCLSACKRPLFYSHLLACQLRKLVYHLLTCLALLQCSGTQPHQILL